MAETAELPSLSLMTEMAELHLSAKEMAEFQLLSAISEMAE